MTLILDNLKRCEGQPLSDGTAPRTTLASLQIIAQQPHVLTVLTRYKATDKTFSFAKAWSKDETGALANVKKHTHTTLSIPTLDALYNALSELAQNHNACVIRGALTPIGEAFYNKHGFVYRRKLEKIEQGQKIAPHFHDVARAWACFDADDILTPHDMRTEAQRAVAWYVENCLPIGFKDVGYVWQLSGSAGHPTKDPKMLRAHVWVLLTAPRTSKELKAWAQQHITEGMTDLSLFDTVQAHYTSNPVLTYCEYTDPCEQRLGIVQGTPLDVPIVSTVDLSRIKNTHTKKELSSKTQQAINAANVSGAFASTFQQTIALNALERSVRDLRAVGKGSRHNTLNRVLYYLYSYVYTGALDENEMLRQLKDAALSIGITYERFLENVKRKQTDFNPLDYSLISAVDDIPEQIKKSNKPLVVESQALWTALKSLSEYPKKLNDCISAIQTTDEPLVIISMTAYTVNLIANNAPFRYGYDDSIKLLKETLGDKIHPLTFAACVEWGKQTGEHIKAKALKSIVISDDAKARHIYQKIDKIANAIPLNTARVMVVRVAMGEGKTRILGKGLCDLAKHNGQRFAALTHRSALVDELCRVLGLTHYKNVGELLNESAADKKKIYNFFGSCVHSIASPYIRTVYESCDTLFIDEAAQMLRALVGIYNKETSTARDTTAQDVYDLLIKAIRTAPKVVLCDAGANDELIEWLESILGNEKIHIVETSKKSGDGIAVNVNFANQQLQGEQAAITAIKARLEAGKKVWISVGTVKVGRLIAQALRGCGRGAFIHSKTPTLEKERFLKNADRASLDYDYVIASPVISCGISVEHRDGHHFDDVFYIGDGSSVVPQDVLQMIRRVRYVKDVQIYTWLPFRQRLGDTTPEKRITDFYTLKTHLTANQNWERQNFVAALCHTLEGVGFNVSYQKVVPETGSTQAAIEAYQLLNETRAFTLNSAQTLSASEYESLKACSAWTQDQIDAMDKYELREHLAQDWNAISTDDLKIWGEGRGRELLARRAACRGIVLQGVEHSPVLCDLYGQIFEGVDIENLTTLNQATAQKIVKNALSVGRVGVQYELLPQSYARRDRQPKSAMKSALVILQQCGYEKKSSNFCTQSPNDLSKSGDTVQKTRERYTHLDRDLIEQLDAVIERLNFREDILDEPTITRPLPDKVTKRDFDTQTTAPQDVDLSAFDFEPLPVTQKDIAHQAKTRQQINAIDPLRYSSMVKCVDCGFLDEKGVDCLVHGDIFLPDALRACDAFSVKEQCA
jgi:putative DNA primase/helicase